VQPLAENTTFIFAGVSSNHQHLIALLFGLQFGEDGAVGTLEFGEFAIQELYCPGTAQFGLCEWT